ncbi:MAG TPA: hypothetical protein VF786_14985 [Terriglobales bacterium]
MNRTEVTHRNRTTTLTILLTLIAFSAIANAEPTDSHKGNLVIKAQTVVQGTTLPPGDYEVREVQTSQGPAVSFVRKFWNEAASEMVQAEEDQLLSQVPVVEQPLSSPARRTQFELSADHTGATALQIRGAAVDFVFEPTQNANHSVAPSNTTIGSN